MHVCACVSRSGHLCARVYGCGFKSAGVGGIYAVRARPGKFAKHDRERRIGELQEKCIPSTTEIGNVEDGGCALVPQRTLPGGKELTQYRGTGTTDVGVVRESCRREDGDVGW